VRPTRSAPASAPSWPPRLGLRDREQPLDAGAQPGEARRRQPPLGPRIEQLLLAPGVVLEGVDQLADGGEPDLVEVDLDVEPAQERAHAGVLGADLVGLDGSALLVERQDGRLLGDHVLLDGGLELAPARAQGARVVGVGVGQEVLAGLREARMMLGEQVAGGNDSFCSGHALDRSNRSASQHRAPRRAGPAVARDADAMTSDRHEVILRDGGSLLLRPIRPDDKARLQDHMSRLGEQSRRHRFFGQKKELSDAELVHLTETDGVDHIALVAVSQPGGHERIEGVGRCFVLPGSAPLAAEAAFAVADAIQGRGVGTVLLEHLARAARARGVEYFEADVEGDNREMLAVFARSGFTVREDFDEGVVRVRFSLRETEHFLAASLARERIAKAQSMRPFFAPRAVAVIGASRRAGTIGRALLDNVIGGGFPGPVYPVNATATELAGRACFPTVSAIGAPVDLAIIAVPAAAVEAAVADCAAAGVRAVVVISAGFAEVSAAGRAAQVRLRALVRGAGMRMVGPNCMGVLTTDPAVRLNATFGPAAPPAGNVSMLSQSGALGLALLDHATSLDLGIASFVSAGNKADVSGNDLLAYWRDDPRTRVIVLYLESIGNPRMFARLAPEVARQKPIVAIKSGRSAAGARAASSHSAALASVDVGIDALFAQAGVLRAATIEEMFDVVALLSSQPVPTGNRIGVITNAGGPGVLFADACEAQGLVLPALADETLHELRQVLPAQAGLGNPIDMIAAASAEQYTQALALVGNDPNIDAVVAIYVPPLVTRPEAIADAIARGAGAIPADRPVATVFLSSKGTPPALAGGPRGRIPSYSFPENAAAALAAAVRYGRWRARPVRAPLRLGEGAEQAIRTRVRAMTAALPADGWLGPADTAALLTAAGIPLVASRAVGPEPAAVVSAAEAIGFPVVVKAIAPGVLHKTEAGAVAIGLGSDAEVRAAVSAMLRRLEEAGTPATGFLIQPRVEVGAEALVGVTRDPSLGPLVVVGLGGVQAEILRDVAFRLPPLSAEEADEMIGELRGHALFDGFRGAPPADRAALADIVGRVAALADLVPELRELDLNPVIVGAAGRGAVVVDARLRLSAPA
jgi:acetyl coenzyme A synthetase (ADP forming)-like protein